MRILLGTTILLLALTRASAQETPTPPPVAPAADLEALQQQVQALTDTVKALQQQVKDQQTALEQANIATTPSATGSLATTPAVNPSPKTSAPLSFPTGDESVVAGGQAPPTAVNAAATNAFPTSDNSVVSTTGPGAEQTVTTTTSTSSSALTQPLSLVSSNGGKTYMNISFDGLFALAYSSARDLSHIEVGDHDPQQRGFNARNLEIALDGAVDPYFEGFANIVLKLNNDNQTEIEAEEAFLQTTSLPWGLQLKGGQFFAPFGRINPTHPHTWEFADDPLVHGLFLGSDGLRGVGAQVAWTVPVSWYSQFLLAVQNGRGNTGYSFRNPGDNGLFFGRRTNDNEAVGLQDFVWVPRFENSFNLSDTQTVLAGVSGAFGSNDTGVNTRTQIYGVDLLYKWKSSHAEGGFPFVKWQSEAMYRRFEAGRGLNNTFPVAETFRDWGLYSQLLWGFKKGWVAGVRGDYVHDQASRFTDDPTRQSRTRLSADLTWYPTEFSKLRLQYNHDFLEANDFLGARQADAVFLQFEFILGAHGAHKF